MAVLVVLITAPKGEGRKLARTLVEAGFAACVNVTSVSSVYTWNGRVEEADEDLIIVKTTDEAYGRLEELVKRVHPYQVPEIIALRVERGLREYTSWVEGSVSPGGGQPIT